LPKKRRKQINAHKKGGRDARGNAAKSKVVWKKEIREQILSGDVGDESEELVCNCRHHHSDDGKAGEKKKSAIQDKKKGRRTSPARRG